MKLQADQLELEVLPVQRAQSDTPYESWCLLRVRVRVPAFVGNFDWHATLDDLSQLAAVLKRLYETVGQEITLDFDPIEPSVHLTFVTDMAGHIRIKYKFIGQLTFGPRLSGEGVLDQSFLPQVIKDVEELAASVRPYAS